MNINNYQMLIFFKYQNSFFRQTKPKQDKSIDVLTPEIVRLFIARIEVGERTEKYSRHSAQKIRIVYRDIGEWDEVADSEENTTPCSEIISESA